MEKFSHPIFLEPGFLAFKDENSASASGEHS
jgi:hypothetical protein